MESGESLFNHEGLAYADSNIVVFRRIVSDSYHSFTNAASAVAPLLPALGSCGCSLQGMDLSLSAAIRLSASRACSSFFLSTARASNSAMCSLLAAMLRLWITSNIPLRPVSQSLSRKSFWSNQTPHSRLEFIPESVRLA